MILNKVLFPLSFLVKGLFFSCKEPGISKPHADRTIAFIENWRFYFGDSVANPSEAQWRTLDVPHDWSIEGKFSHEHPAGVGGGAITGGLIWYRKVFKVVVFLKLFLKGRFTFHRENGSIIKPKRCTKVAGTRSKPVIFLL